MPNSRENSPQILGIGVDLVEIPRLQASLQRTGDAFLKKVYTPAEVEGAPQREPRRSQYLAGRWAAKEALAKALGTGITAQCPLQDIQTLNLPDGRPQLTLLGTARKTADALGVSQIHVSLTHETQYAVAMVLLSGTPGKPGENGGVAR